jgi:hypothetical protein
MQSATSATVISGLASSVLHVKIVLGQLGWSAASPSHTLGGLKLRAGAFSNEHLSNSANALNVSKTKTPCAVVVSLASVGLRKPMPRNRNFSTVSMSCFIDRSLMRGTLRLAPRLPESPIRFHQPRIRSGRREEPAGFIHKSAFNESDGLSQLYDRRLAYDGSDFGGGEKADIHADRRCIESAVRLHEHGWPHRIVEHRR